MQLQDQPPHLVATFYRVSLKAIIFDEQRRLLVYQNAEDEWEMPGGGWEQGESAEDCLRRELKEEVNATVTEVGNVLSVYSLFHSGGNWKLCIAYEVKIADGALVPDGDEVAKCAYVAQEKFMRLPFNPNEAAIIDHAESIWSESERSKKLIPGEME